MTISELALNLIEHSDEPVTQIDLDRAAQLIGYLDPDNDLPEDLTPEAFMEAWNEIVPHGQISIDNGRSFVSPADAIAQMSWDVIVNAMDDDTRETVHAELAPCTDEEFLTRYLELAPFNLIIG